MLLPPPPPLPPRSALVIAASLLPALALLVAPLCGRRVRTALAALLGFAALGFIVDILVIDHSHSNTLDVPNLFPRGPEVEPYRWTTATVTAPAWHYHVWLAAVLALPALLLFLRRGRAPAAPAPVAYGFGVYLYYFGARLGLELTAAPEVVVWNTGSANAMLLMLPFVAWYAARRGLCFKQLVVRFLLLALVQRALLITVAYVATTQHLGTHLDTHVVTDIAVPGIGEIQLADDTARWLYPTLIPHLTVWVLLTLVAGVVLGFVPFRIAKGRGGCAVHAPVKARA